MSKYDFEPHPTPLLLPCVRCLHRGACVYDGTVSAETCDGYEPEVYGPEEERAPGGEP